MNATHLEAMADDLIAVGLVKPEDGRQLLAAMQWYWADKIALVWTAKDIMDCYPELERWQVEDELLGMMFDEHDASIGMNWAVIDTLVDMMKENYR
jgi:hypothetical protein